MIRISLFDSPEALAGRAADYLLDRVSRREHETPFSIALSGGSTPGLLYQALVSSSEAKDRLSTGAEYFFSDERSVGPDDEQSNYRTANLHLFQPLEIPTSIIHRMNGEATDLKSEAARYAQLLRDRVSTVKADLPSLDLTILGMGGDGHTASLFPGYDFDAVGSGELVVSPYVRKLQTYRLSFSLSLINASQRVMVLVAGSNKAAALRQVLQRATDEPLLPAARVTAPEMLWLVDRAAAAQLDPEDSRIGEIA